jgi:hypothetical protein
VYITQSLICVIYLKPFCVLQCSKINMDKSWMTKCRGSREYMEGAEAFVKYAVTNSKNKNSIVCPCKKCGLNRSLWPKEVYDHLTGGMGIMPNYTE